MNLSVRKIVVGLLVLGVLLSAYLAYIQVNESPLVDMDTSELSSMPMMDPASEGPGGQAGQVGDARIGRLKDTEFLHTDDSGRVDRKFGFDQLIHSEGNQWVITNPYMMLFMGDINCRVTASKGQVEVKTTLGQSHAGDAMFSGNVVIRIVPADPSDPRAVFIYLDDVAFIAEQSLFSTNNAVKFVARSAQLVGRGMELLYDESTRRLQLFRIRDLESLRLRSDELGSLSARSREDDAGASSAEPDRPVVAAQTAETPGEVGEPNAADIYECVFHNNVSVSTPEQLIMARTRFTIANVMWSGSASKDGGAETVDAGGGGAIVGAVEPIGTDSEVAPLRGPDALDTTPSESFALEAIPESFFDIVVACDGGFVVAPKGSAALLPDPNRPPADETGSIAGLGTASEPSAADPNRQTVTAQRIDFDFSTTDITLAGPVGIGFSIDANDLTGGDSDGGSMPVTITARDSVQYFSATNHIQLEGRCAVTLQQTEPNYTYEYMLTAPRLTLDLMDDPNAGPADTGIAVKRFAAEGGPVAFNARRRRGGVDDIGWVQLYASRLGYDETEKEFRITGPGKINLFNGEDLDPEADPNEFSVGRPCYAFIQDFDTLTYSALTNLVVAEIETETESDPIFLKYCPLVNDVYDPNGPQAYAGRIEIALAQTAKDRTELVSLTASEGIWFEDSESQFAGATLFYDHAKSLLTVEGDSVQPCSFNGAYVDRIEMDPKTSNTKAIIETPSTVEISR